MSIFRKQRVVIEGLIDALIQSPSLSPPTPARDSTGKYYYAFPIIENGGKFNYILLCFGYGDVVEAARHVCGYAVHEYRQCSVAKEKLVAISMLDRLDDSPAVRVFLYKGDARDEAGVKDVLIEVVNRNNDDAMAEPVYGWEDFFHWYSAELADAGFVEITGNEDETRNVNITGLISMSLHCDECVADLV